MKLSRKIYSYFGTFILFIVLAFMAVNYFVVERTLHQNARSELLVMTESVNAAADTILHAAMRNYLDGILKHYLEDLHDLHRKYQNGLLTEQQAKDAFQKHSMDHSVGREGYIVALRQQGEQIIADIHPYARGRDCSDNKGCREWIEQKNGFNHYLWKNPDDENPRHKVGSFHYFEPWDWVVGVTSYEEEFIQLVEVEDLRPLVESFKVLNRGYFFVLDEDLNILIHPELEGGQGMATVNADGVYIIQEMVKRLEEIYYYFWQNPSETEAQEKFAYVTKLDHFNWYIAASGYVDDIRGPAYKVLQASYVLAFLAAAVLALLTVRFSHSLKQPLDELINGLHEFYRDRKVFRMPFRSVNEIESVGHAIETLTDNLVSAEQEKQSLLAQLDEIVDSMPSALIGVDDRLNVIFMNDTAEGFTRTSKEQILQRPLAEALVDHENILAAVQAAARQREKFNELFQIPVNSHRNQYLDVTVYPLSEHLRETVIRIDDVTERVQVEESMHQSRKMEAIGQLAGGVAHDFNNLLAGIQNSAYLLERKFTRDEKEKKYLKIIKDASHRAAELTLKLLAFSRKDAKVSTRVHVHDALKEAVDILKRSVDKTIDIQLALNAGNDAVVGDLSQLQSVFMNMGINASHAMAGGGVLRYSSTEVWLQAEDCSRRDLAIPPGHYLQIDISDTGAGIPPDIIDQLFEPFFTTKGEGKGTGLGLWSASVAAEQHGGVIKVFSEVGKGTIFTLFLPLTGQSVTTPKPEVHGIVHGSGTILLVDDEELLRTTTRGMLDVMGYEVLTAADGEEGLELFRRNQGRIDLVLLDMIMPKMGGRVCFQEIRKLDAGVPVVFVSGFSNESDLQEVLAGGEAFIAKPYDAVTLSKVIAESLKTSG